MALEGELTVDLIVEGERVRAARVTSTRRVDACRSLVGLPVAAALQSVPLLFGVCAEAQGAAAREACEVALGAPASEDRRAARELRLACEAIDSHALQVALKWPEVFGGTPAVAPLRALRQRTAALRRVATEPARAGRGAARAEARALRAHLSGLLGAQLPADPEALGRWSDGEGVAQRAVATLRREGLSDFGQPAVQLLPALSAGWIEARLAADPAFERLPVYEGLPAEVGVLARRSASEGAHPLVSALVARHQHGLLTRFVARVAELEALGARVCELAQNLRASLEIELAERFSGRGAAVVDTARGPLAHVVRIEEGRVAGWRVVAPTEWNFHPAGALVVGLRGAQDLQGLRRHAGWLVNELDPCVGYEVRLRGAANA